MSTFGPLLILLGAHPLVVLALSLPVLLGYLLRPRPLPLIPVIPGALPFFGHSLAILRYIRANDGYEGWFHGEIKNLGTPVLSQVMMSWNAPLINLVDPEQMERICSSADYDTSDTTRGIFDGAIPLAMLARRTDSIVKFHRKAFAYSHSAPFLALTGSYFAAHFDLLLAKWAKAAENGTFFPVESDLKHLMTDTIAQVSFGESFHQLATGKPHPVAEAMDGLFNSLGGGPLIGIRHWIERRRSYYKSAYKTFNEYFNARVEHARDKIRGGGEIAEVQCLIDIVMRKEARDGEGNVMPEDELRDEMALATVAGEETTQSTFLWALRIMSEHPHIQQELHNTLVEVLPLPAERAPTTSDVGGDATPYLEACVHEILRVSGVLPFTDRQAIRDTTLVDGAGIEHRVPKGTIVGMPNWHTATHILGEDGKLFRPERWLDGDKGGKFDATKVWMRPFGGGTRMCYGYRQAMVFLRLFLAQLSLTYFVRPLPDELTSTRTKHYVTRRPAINFVGLQRWEEAGEKPGDL